MSEKDINRWYDAMRANHEGEWRMDSGEFWRTMDIPPISDSMLAELAQHYSYSGTPWNCHSMFLSDGDREYMYLLYFSMQGLVARMRQAEAQTSVKAEEIRRLWTRFGKVERFFADAIRARDELLAALRAVVASERLLPDHPVRQAAYAEARAAAARVGG